MTNPLHASHYADAALKRQVEIVENVSVAEDTFRVRFACPEIADRIIPGQFLMMRLADCVDPLIGRAFAVYDVIAGGAGDACSIDVVYHVKGKFTARLAESFPGRQLVVWGPLGNGFPPLVCDHLILIAGGVGQTPFLTLAKEHLGLQRYGSPRRKVEIVPRVTLVLGAQSERFLANVADFQRLGVDVRLATDDGSVGHRGFVTDVLSEVLEADCSGVQIVSCGPMAMMRRAAEIAAQTQVPCYVSLETPMACGVGICFSCVARIRDERGDWDYKRTCVDGPVFDATRIMWS